VPWLGVAETKVTPAGKVSVSVTPVAVLGPPLATVTTYVMVCPARTGSGESVLVTARSTAALTVVLCMVVLLAGLVSASFAVAVAVFVIVPGAAGAVTTMVRVALAPLLMVRRLPVTVLPTVVTVPWLGVAETNVTPAGKVS